MSRGLVISLSAGPQMPASGGPVAQRVEMQQQRPWSGRRVSNPQPSAWEADALPIELLPLALRHFFAEIFFPRQRKGPIVAADNNTVKVSTETPHVNYLDGLRALAVSLVVIRHVVLFAPALATGVWLHVLDEGAHGVDLFFIISGFCLSYPTLLALKSDGRTHFKIPEFFAKRLVRIVPPYWIALGAIILTGQLLINSGTSIAQTGISMPSVWQTLSQLVFFDHVDLTNSSFWSLAVEFRWYLLFPILLWLWVSKRQAFWAIVAVCVIGYQFTTAGGVDMGTLPCFMLGIVAAAIQVDGNVFRKWALPLVPLAVAAAVLLEPIRGAAWLGQDQFGWHVAAFLFVVTAGVFAPLRAVLGWAPLRAIGLASYSIYLLHEPLLGIFIGRMDWLPSVGLTVLICFAFWAVFERTLLLAPIRKRLVATVVKPVAKLLRLVGSPDALYLHALAPVNAAGDAPVELRVARALPAQFELSDQLKPETPV